MPGVFVEARERKTFPVSDTVRALVSGSCHGCPRVSPCCPVSYCLPKTLILIDAVAWRVVVYLMVKETNGLPKLVVVGSNPIARSNLLPFSSMNPRQRVTKGVCSLRGERTRGLAPSVGARRQASGPIWRRSAVQIPSPAPTFSIASATARSSITDSVTVASELVPRHLFNSSLRYAPTLSQGFK